MKKSNLLITIAIVAGIIFAIWVWDMAVSRNSNSGSYTVDETELQKSGWKLQSHKPVIKEKRFSMVFRPGNGSDSVGSITLKAAGNGYMLISTERPGDAMMMSLGGMFGGGGGGMQTTIGTADGSEIRFVGTFETTNGIVTGEQGSRLVFRKADGDWVYVSGIGQYEEQGNITKLGHDRTVESCLDLLKSEDPILREGGARDLGRLCRSDDADYVIPQLVAMLKDSSVYVRRGVIEGLGLIGTSEAEISLQAGLAEEMDKTTREFFEEALSFCAAYAILCEPATASIPSEVGLDRLLGKSASEDKNSSDSKKELSGWIEDNLVRRVADHKEEALVSLEKAVASSNIRIAQAALIIKTSLELVMKEQ